MTFLPDITVLATFFVASFVLAITPGPDMTFFLSTALTQGRKAGASAVMGAMSGAIIHSILAAAGISVLLAASQVGFTVLKVVGALYLLYLAYQMVRNGSSFTVSDNMKPQTRKRSVWVKGLMINLLNPKIVLFFVTFLPQFVSATDPFASQKLMFLGIFFICVSSPCCLAMVWGADKVANFLRTSPRVMRLLDYSFASIITVFAAKLLLVRSAVQ